MKPSHAQNPTWKLNSKLLYFIVAGILIFIGYRGLTKPAVAPGSPLAARLLAAAYVGETSGFDPVYVNEEPVIRGDKAMVRTVYGTNKGCTVGMVRSAADREYGWLVTAIACGPAHAPKDAL